MCPSGPTHRMTVNIRYLNFYGQHGARINSHQTVYGDVGATRTLLIGLLSPPLFFAPTVHLETLEGIWVDQVLAKHKWSSLLVKLRDEWQGAVLFVSEKFPSFSDVPITKDARARSY